VSPTARDEVLARIRAAIGSPAARPWPADGRSDDASPEVARPDDGPPGTACRRAGDLTGAALLDRLSGRLADYRALVRTARPDSLGDQVAAALRARGARRIVVPPGLTVPLPDWAEVTVDDGLSAAELDGFDGVVTTAAAAVADTGTIVLDGGPGQGRRAISLVPDYHLCVVPASVVVQLVPEAVARLAGSAARPLTWISGPSATSDIELERVEGVHGPRTLEVVLVSQAGDQ
jgi:L-lactate dehydrogenase complex protein LldG